MLDNPSHRIMMTLVISKAERGLSIIDFEDVSIGIDMKSLKEVLNCIHECDLCKLYGTLYLDALTSLTT